MTPVRRVERVQNAFGRWRHDIPATTAVVAIGITLFVVESATASTQQALHVLGYHRQSIIDHHELWRLCTPVLTDPASWGPWHPLSLTNTVLVLAVGPRIERVVGSCWFVTIYVVAELIGLVAILSLVPSFRDYGAGSSAAVAGIYGAVVATATIRTVRLHDIRRFPWGVPVSVLLVVLVSLSLPSESNAAHLTGALTGLAIASIRTLGPVSPSTRSR